MAATREPGGMRSIRGIRARTSVRRHAASWDQRVWHSTLAHRSEKDIRGSRMLPVTSTMRTRGRSFGIARDGSGSQGAPGAVACAPHDSYDSANPSDRQVHLGCRVPPDHRGALGGPSTGIESQHIPTRWRVGTESRIAMKTSSPGVRSCRSTGSHASAMPASRA